MTTPVAIPRLGWEMQEAVLVEWLVDDGDEIGAGDPLYVIESDKADQEIESPAAGIVRIKGVPGETYDVGHLIAEIEHA
jgi:pyruvate/2-oxoglutarate dehydrogenase complex dihydrolipoamide acyltransferase (E2) component